MKICFIGMCGHSLQAYNTLKKRADSQFVGVAPGSAHENMTRAFDSSVPFYPSWEEMLDSVHPDLAVISPVFGLTGQIIVECAKRGIDIFSEKPVASSLAELSTVERTVKEAGIRFCAMHYLRYTPSFYHGAKLVHDGAIGEIRMMTAQKSYRFGTRPDWYKDRSLYGGTIPWVGIHAIDWVYFFSETRFRSVKALSFGNPERAALCQFEMDNGVMASVNVDYYRPEAAPSHDDDRIRCVGTEGVLEVIGNRITLIDKNGVTVFEPCEAPDLLEEFLSNRPVISPDDIFYVTRAALSARDSADSGKTVTIQ